MSKATASVNSESSYSKAMKEVGRRGDVDGLLQAGDTQEEEEAVEEEEGGEPS